HLVLLASRFYYRVHLQKGREAKQNPCLVSTTVTLFFGSFWFFLPPFYLGWQNNLPLGQVLGQVYSLARMRTPFALLAGLFAVLIAPSTVALAKAADRPNIIFFLSDDHRWDRMGCAGHPFLKTPTMDRLAAQGVRFSNMFVTTSICAASRATLLTGLYERTHQYTFGTPPIAGKFSQASYPAVLRVAGYRTGFIGKFGVNIAQADRELMFDSFQPIGRNPYLKKQPDGSLRHESELAGDRAIEFINQQKGDAPFC
ncbi:uncharacterized protein METZ01_LOCUS451489, partial [marine metagenome]